MKSVPAVLRDRYPHIRFARHWEIGSDVHYQLGQCDAVIRSIRETPLSPERGAELLQVALIKGAQATTAIEGNTLTSEEVQQVAAGASLSPSKAYQEREVRNVLDAMNRILGAVAERGAAPPVSPALVRDFHRQIGRELGEHLDAVPGQLRTDERVVGPYRCPRAEDVPALLDLLCDWLREEFAPGDGPGAFRNAVVQAIVAHVYIEWIHPFGDGNGRTGRLLEFYLLLRAGNPDVASHILSNFYNLTRPEYYRQLDQGRRSRDLTTFIAYAVQGYRDGLLETLGRIQELQLETAWRVLVHDTFAKRPYRKKSVFKRQRELMLQVPLHAAISLDELPTRTIHLARAYAALTEKTLVRDVQVLTGMDLIVRDLDTGGYRANLDLLKRRMPRRRPPAVAARSTPARGSV
ncbi:MAG: Fic family protein [Acidobacteriota bacterium]|nr:Fic family protein [Acidobacteriota bacterium]